MNCKDSALQLVALGYSVIPIRLDGSKRPAISWKRYQKQPATEQEVEGWFSADPAPGIGVVCGAVSGNLVVIDFDHDGPETFASWWANVTSKLPGIERQIAVVATPRPGRQVWVRLPSEPEGSQVLAWTDPRAVEGTPEPSPQVLIETRGSGGYVVAVGSAGSVHPTGRPYSWIHGSAELEPISAEQWQVFRDTARSLTKYQPEHVLRPAGQRYTGIPRPGDIYNQEADVRELLTKHGWQLNRQTGDSEHWTRPGKPISEGSSATLGAIQTDDGRPCLYVFSSNAKPFQAGQTYDPFGCFALLEHGGDYSRAAAAVRILFAQQVETAQRSWAEANEQPAELGYEAFPIQNIPTVVREYVSEQAEAIGADVAFVVVPMLSVLAGLIGQTRQLTIKRSWTEPAIIWTAVVSGVSTGKTPGWQAATAPAQRIEQLLNDQRQAEKREFKRQLREYLQSDKSGPKPIEQPFSKQLTIDDSSMEALFAIHNDNWRGLLLAVDELAGWLQSFNQYRKGGDVERWLSIYNGKPLQVNRKTDNYRLYLPSTAVSVCGGIQPDIARNTLYSERFVANGLSARVLTCRPPANVLRWTDQEPSRAKEQAMFALAEQLYSLTGEQYETDRYRSRYLSLTEPAKKRLQRFMNETADYAETLEPALQGSWLKLRPMAARIALVFSVVDQLTSSPSGAADQPVDLSAIEAGIALVGWFGRELERNYRSNDQAGADTLQSHLAWIRTKHPDGVDARQLQIGRRSIESSDQARAVLQELVAAGLGRLDGGVFVPQ